MICPALSQPVPSPCPRGECQACLEALVERAAILQYGQGTGGSPETPTCATRDEADRLARDQLRAALGLEQQELF